MREPEFIIQRYVDKTPIELLNSEDKTWIFKNSPLKGSIDQDYISLTVHASIVTKGSFQMRFFNSDTFSSTILDRMMFYPGDGMVSSSSDAVNCTHLHVRGNKGQFDEVNKCTTDNFSGHGKHDPYVFAPMEAESEIVCVQAPDPSNNGAPHVIGWKYLDTNEQYEFPGMTHEYYTVLSGAVTINDNPLVSPPRKRLLRQKKKSKTIYQVSSPKAVKVVATEPSVFLVLEEETFT
jgi:hypothetical protein